MVTVARDAQSKTPALTSAPSSFHEALDSVGRVIVVEISHRLNPHSTGSTLRDLPWNRGIFEGAQRGVDVINEDNASKNVTMTYPLRYLPFLDFTCACVRVEGS